MLLKRVPKGEADERDNDQMTPLHWSASYGNAEHIKLLLKAASTVTLIDEQSMSSRYSHCTMHGGLMRSTLDSRLSGPVTLCK